MAHALAYASENVRADMVEATEFPHLSYKYNVRRVPRIVVNETHHFEGAMPEEMYIAKVLEAIGVVEQGRSLSVAQ